MGKILVPTSSPEDWKKFLAEPDKHWKRGYSARAIAYCWQTANGLPSNVKAVLTTTPALEQIETLFAIPEHQVPLPGGSRPSQNDVWVLARTPSDLVSIAVEGKVSEPFGPIIAEWKPKSSPGKERRLRFLCTELGLAYPPPDDIRYQLLHRTASAIIEAKRFHARHAIMLVHSFSQADEWFSDYRRFLTEFNITAAVDDIAISGEVSNITLYFAWVRGEKQHLEA